MSRVEISGGDGAPVRDRLRPPGSKSHSIRALFIAALANGTSAIVNPLQADDTERAVAVLRQLGVEIEESDGRLTVSGTGGRLTVPGSPLDVGESGLTARFAIATSQLVPGPVTIRGRGRIPERPMSGLVDVLISRGMTVTSRHPWTIDGGGQVSGGEVVVEASESSQMVSALLVPAPLADTPTVLRAAGLRSSGAYIEITTELMEVFDARLDASTPDHIEVSPGGYKACDYQVPIDASALVYPAAAAAITGGEVTIEGDPGEHPDVRFLTVLEQMGCAITLADSTITVVGPVELDGVSVDMSQAPDAAVALAVVAALANGPSEIRGLESLRHKESDRIAALVSELTKIGARVEVAGDTMSITPGRFPGSAEVDSHGDHRIAMSLALVGLVHDRLVVTGAEAVSKTWPGYWDWFAGLGPRLAKG